MKNHQPKHIDTGHLKSRDYEQLLEAMKAAYKDWQGSYWTPETINKLILKFPEGQLSIKVDEVIVGCALSIIVDYDKYGDTHTYKEITGNYTFSTHDPVNGDVLYGIEIFIHPEYRGLRLGRRLYEARKDLCEHLNLRAIIFGGRIPEYHKYAGTLSPKEFIQKVKAKEIYDPVLSFQLANDFHVKKVLKNYMPEDQDSLEFATLLQWDNIYYESESRKLFSSKTYVRLGLIQWQMRPYANLDEMFEQVEFFIDSVAAYKSDFALLPELFNGPLMADFNDLTEAGSLRALAGFTPELKTRFRDMAIKYNVNIITGSVPSLEGDTMKNVGFLCHRNGHIDVYEKLHITPDEAKFWGIRGGSTLKVYDTDAGKIGILICYDVEFPELARLLAEQGMQILFVPFLTDTQNAYNRVRYCAQARAVENECFVAITGCIGNLPKVENMDIQYSQAAVFTPCDFAFPADGVKNESTANTEMILISDIDLSLLDELHSRGSVRNLKDRRTDFYELTLKHPPADAKAADPARHQ